MFLENIYHDMEAWNFWMLTTEAKNLILWTSNICLPFGVVVTQSITLLEICSVMVGDKAEGPMGGILSNLCMKTLYSILNSHISSLLKVMNDAQKVARKGSAASGS